MKPGNGTHELDFVKDNLLGVIKLVSQERYRVLHYILSMAIAEADHLSRNVPQRDLSKESARDNV